MSRDRYVIRETDHAQYLVVPDFEVAGGLHFFGLKASFQRPAVGPIRFSGIPVVTAKQVHGDQVLVVQGGLGQHEIALAEDDALVTAERGFFIGIYTADCLPILLSDPERNTVAAVHAGWRGSLMGVVAKAVQQMKIMGSQPEEILAALGPGIGKCCYEVGPLVLDPLGQIYSDRREFVEFRGNGKGMLDLVELNRRQLLAADLREENLFTTGLCTYCRPDLFSSFRREGQQMRGMLSGIMRV